MRTISQLGISRVSVSAIVTSSAFGTPNDNPFFITSETACNTFGNAIGRQPNVRDEHIELGRSSKRPIAVRDRDRDLVLSCCREALVAARGSPGLAAEWLRHGGLKLREQVRTQLDSVATGRSGAIEIAQLWLADDNGEARLRFAADLALEAAGECLGAIPADPAKPAGDFSRLSHWFDSINRTREQLRAPVRNDLVVAGLLREWRNMFQAAR